MTQLKPKPLRRETAISIRVRGRLLPLMMDIYPGFIVYRPKGCRASGGHAYVVPHDSAWRLGAKLKAEERRRERAAKKTARKRSKTRR